MQELHNSCTEISLETKMEKIQAYYVGVKSDYITIFHARGPRPIDMQQELLPCRE